MLSWEFLNKWLLRCCVLLCLSANGQTQHLSLNNGFALPFQGKLYVGGFDTLSKKITVFECDGSLKKRDSVRLEVPYTLMDYYPITADTLHCYLQLVIQRKNATTVTLIRLRGCKPVSQIEKMEVPRLYHSTRPGNYFFEPNRFYKIEKLAYTDFNRFRLTALDISDTTGNLSYVQKWEYMTDKPGVVAINILGSNQHAVYVHAIRENQAHYSSWLLKFNRKNGQLVHAKRLELGAGDGILSVSAFIADTVNNYLLIGGQTYSKSEIKKSPDGITFQSSQPSVVMIKVDSLMESMEWRRINFSIDPKVPKLQWQCYLRLLSTSPFNIESAVTFYYNTEPEHYCLGNYKTVAFDFTSDLNLINIKFSGPVYEFISLHKKHNLAFSIKESKVTEKMTNYHNSNQRFAIGTKGQEAVYFLTAIEKQNVLLYRYALEGKAYKLVQQKESTANISSLFNLNDNIILCTLTDFTIELKTLFHKD